MEFNFVKKPERFQYTCTVHAHACQLIKVEGEKMIYKGGGGGYS